MDQGKKDKIAAALTEWQNKPVSHDEAIIAECKKRIEEAKA